MAREYNELYAFFAEKYGEDWTRTDDLTEDEEREWVESCYDFYEKREPWDEFESSISDNSHLWRAPFEIVEPISVDDPDYDLDVLPLWRIRITGGDYEGEETVATPEEIWPEPC